MATLQEQLDDRSKDILMVRLTAQYSVVSEALEFFPKGSKHKGAVFLNNKLLDIMNKINILNAKELCQRLKTN
jgi:hypothetical protein